jgi:hypothetical protein
MAHFAQIENNTVVNVIVVDNQDIIIDGVESEQKGLDFIESLGLGTNWIQTSYNHKFRNKFAGLGDKYDSVNDVFVSDETEAIFLDSWQGIIQPTSPSIMFDAVARSANMWTLSVLKQAFPKLYLRWGYISQHSKESFAKGIDNFDITMTVVRNPLDSIASYLLAFNVEDEKEIITQIQEAKEILDETFANKSKIKIYKFEDMTVNSENIMSEIGLLLNLTPEPFDEYAIKESLKTEGTDFYSVPQDNQDKLNAAKDILNEPKYGIYMAEAIQAYERVIS